ncbi:MAG TPA: Nif3-like dinuclear metal center hexameric protein [Cyclobacteriaceae bacterium]
MTKIKEITAFLETIAPRNFQESYDNSGLLTGSSSWIVSGVLVTLDCTEDVVQEAIDHKINLIIAHHPIIFKGLKKLTGQNYVERTIIKAIKNDIAIYAIHTNLDNVDQGVNKQIAETLGLINLKILAPKTDTLAQLVTFAPKEKTAEVLQALHEAGAGNIGNYTNCSHQSPGIGSFLPTANASPTVGTINELEKTEEDRIEVIFPIHLESRILGSLRKAHPYEEVAYYVTRLENENQEVGSGMIGELSEAAEPNEFLKRLKTKMKAGCIRHTALIDKKIRKVAVCGGSGSFLLSKAVAAGADIYISADFKYHEFFDADRKIIIADIGHYESEQYTKELIIGILKEKFTTFAINFSKTVTNPISYI